jgi:hypothetical protein
VKYFSLIDRAGFQGAIRKKRASRSDGQRRLKIEPLEARMLLSASPTIHFDKLPPSTIYDSQDTVRLEWHAEDVDGDLYSDGGTLSSPTGGHPYSSGSTYFTTPIYKGKMHSINVNMVWCMNKYGLGKYTLEVDAEDRAGHIRTASRSFTIEDDDTDGPEIALTNANDQFDGDDNTVSWSPMSQTSAIRTHLSRWLSRTTSSLAIAMTRAEPSI